MRRLRQERRLLHRIPQGVSDSWLPVELGLRAIPHPLSSWGESLQHLPDSGPGQPGGRELGSRPWQAHARICPSHLLSFALPAATTDAAPAFSLFQSQHPCCPALPAKLYILGESHRLAGQEGPVGAICLCRRPSSPGGSWTEKAQPGLPAPSMGLALPRARSPCSMLL